MTEQNSSLADFERAEIQKLETLVAQIGAAVTAFGNRFPPANSAEVAGFTGQVQQQRLQMQGFDAAARKLAAAGRGALANRLAANLKGMDDVFHALQAMHAKALQKEAERRGMDTGVAQHHANAVADVVKRQAGVAAAANKAWSDNAFNKCPFCGMALPNRTDRYCPNPNCRHELPRP